jgi:hypothetical protein
MKAQMRCDAYAGQMVGGLGTPRWWGDGRRRFLTDAAVYNGRGGPVVNGDDLNDFLL